MTIAGKQNALREWQFCTLLDRLQSEEEEDGYYLKSIGYRLGKQEKAKWEHLWYCVESKMNRFHTFLHLLV